MAQFIETGVAGKRQAPEKVYTSLGEMRKDLSTWMREHNRVQQRGAPHQRKWDHGKVPMAPLDSPRSRWSPWVLGRRGQTMARKRCRPEEIAKPLQQAEAPSERWARLRGSAGALVAMDETDRCDAFVQTENGRGRTVATAEAPARRDPRTHQDRRPGQQHCLSANSVAAAVSPGGSSPSIPWTPGTRRRAARLAPAPVAPPVPTRTIWGLSSRTCLRSTAAVRPHPNRGSWRSNRRHDAQRHHPWVGAAHPHPGATATAEVKVGP